MAAGGPIIILGAQGNIGRRLMAAFPGALGIDRAPGADIVADLRRPGPRRPWQLNGQITISHAPPSK